MDCIRFEQFVFPKNLLKIVCSVVHQLCNLVQSAKTVLCCQTWSSDTYRAASFLSPLAVLSQVMVAFGELVPGSFGVSFFVVYIPSYSK